MIPFRFCLRLTSALPFFLASTLCAAPSLLLSGGGGFTHYNPDDLNEVNRVFEEVSRSVGFSGYTVETFSGHSEKVLGLGLAWKHVQAELEAEIWRESFGQIAVGFNLSTYNLAGTVTASEDYTFVPLCLMVKYRRPVGRFIFAAGYGPGIMLGGARVNIQTGYSTGQSSDTLNLKLTSGANLIHRFGLDAQFRIFPWLGLGVSAGYRFSVIKYLEVSGKQGGSKVFNLLFNGGADTGDRLYLGYGTLNFVPETEVMPQHHLVLGDITGYFVWIKANILIPLKRSKK
jgi:hypothetical protein